MSSAALQTCCMLLPEAYLVILLGKRSQPDISGSKKVSRQPEEKWGWVMVLAGLGGPDEKF